MNRAAARATVSGVADDLDDRMVVLGDSEARLVVHVLETFERLLRYGHLSGDQLRLLTADDAGEPDASADLVMARVVAEACEPIQQQLE